MKNAAFVVRPRLCDDEASVRITGVAEGIVNGARQTVPLRLVPLPTPGVHAVTREWPAQGHWLVNLTGTCPATNATASTLVPVTRTGFLRERTQVLREVATRAQIDALLYEWARVQS